MIAFALLRTRSVAACLLCSILSSTPGLAAPDMTATSPNPGSTVPALSEITITFSEPVSGVDPNDLIVNAASATSVSGTGEGPYVFSFTQPPAGEVSVSFDFDHGIAAVDGTGAFSPTDGWTYQLEDTLAPKLGKILSSDVEQLATEPLPGSHVTTLTETVVTFSEPVTGVNASDLLVSGVPATSLTAGAGARTFSFALAQPAAGEVELSWAPDAGIADPAGNAFDPASGGWSVMLTTVAPPTLRITEFSAANATGPEDEDGDTPDWLEIYNPGPGTVDLTGWSLTKEPELPSMWVFPETMLEPESRIVIFASGKDRKADVEELHTNFSLDLRGGFLALMSPESPRTAVHEIADYPEQPYDVSYGLTGDGQDFRYFASPTPGEPNGDDGLVKIAPRPTVSVSRGFFAESFSLVMSSSDPTAVVRYTLNGNEPTAESTAYTQPLEIDKTTILRAAAFAPSSVRSRTVTHSYLYLDDVLSQPEPPYDNPEEEDDDENPPLPRVGDYIFPIDWGTQSGAGFPGRISNIGSNRAPADYGMDPEIVDDPAKYNDDGEVDEENGITNRERIWRSFRELPLLSIVVDNEDFFGRRGMHWNSQVKGTRYEKPCSIELLLPDGTTGFATTCGLRLHGNASREPRKCPKHGLKLNFKGEFGASKLDYQLFPDSPATEFDDIIVRGDFNSSWLHWDGGQQRPRGTRLRDAYCKDTFRDMGRAAGHHRYVHLFINGLYWGTYDMTEQENSNFAANTFGGDRDDYDVYEQGQRKSGSSTVYNAMRRIRQPIDNSDYETMKTLLDVPWLADYMILHFYLGHQDWGGNINKNWYAVRHKDGTYRYLPWDMENLMWSERQNSTTVSAPPTGLHTNLDSNDQYLLDFADRAHRAMVAPDGALRPEAMQTRWRKWRKVMQDAIAAESARWGDYRRDVHRHQSGPYTLFTWNGDWIEENNRLLNDYFPVRTDLVLEQMRRRDLYPELNAPEFRDTEGNLIGSQRVASGFQVTFSFPDPLPRRSRNGGEFYYTTDGSDPRVYFDTTGQRTPAAMAYSSPITVSETTTIKARALDGTEWSALMEATFIVGSTRPDIRITEIHYNPPGGLGGEALEFVELTNHGSAEVDLGKWSFDGINFIMPWGTALRPGERLVIASDEAPNTFASQYPDVNVLGYFRGALNNDGERLTLLDDEGHLVTSVEFGDRFPWPEEADNEGSSLELVNPGGDPQSPANWRASPGTGSPGLPNATVEPTVYVSEFLAGENGFVELGNAGDSPVDVGGWKLESRRRGVLATVPAGTNIPPGGFITLTTDGTPLATDADTLFVSDTGENLIDSVRYGPQVARQSFGRPAPFAAWVLGSPTRNSANIAVPTASQTQVRVNEWLADPAPGFDDWLELYNADANLPAVVTDLQIGVNGEFYSIAVPAAIAPAQAVQLNADRGARRGDALLLRLPSRGAELVLETENGDAIDTVSYGAQIAGITQGRLPDGGGDVIELPFASPGAPNHLPADSDPAISEVLVINRESENAPWARRPAWVEIANPAASALELEGWMLRAIGDASEAFVFPAGTTLAANGYLRVWSDPSVAKSGSNCGLTIDGSYEVWGIELVNPDGQTTDGVTWGRQLADRSIGRIGDGSWALLNYPSPGAANASAAKLGDPSTVRLNEWFADASGSAIRLSYIEFFNSGSLPLGLGGLWLSDEPSEAGRRKWQVPDLTFVGAREHVVFQSGTGTSQPDRFLFDLNAGGEYLRLGNDDAVTSVIEKFSFGGSDQDASWGRLPDGTGNIAVTPPTPAQENSAVPGPSFTQHPESVSVPSGASFELSVSSPTANNYQWLRNGDALDGETSASLKFENATRSDDGIYACTVTNVDGSRTSNGAVVSVLYTYAAWATETGAGAPNADDDGDGRTNLEQFLGIAGLNIEMVPGSPRNVSIEISLDRSAVFSQLLGDASPNLRDPWTAIPVGGSEPQTDGQTTKFYFAAPDGFPERYYRLRFEP